MIAIGQFIEGFNSVFPQGVTNQPWEIIDNLENILRMKIAELGKDYKVQNDIAIHKTVAIEQGVVLKRPVIISEKSFIGANAYFRGPVYLGKSVKIGPGSEIKQSIILDNSAIAHFNYIGNSIIGKNINFEAGSICANHYNERPIKTIFVNYNGQIIETTSRKFGSLVGDGSKIGANAVLSPGTILEPESIVKRLELIDQTK